jgi:hypothetical protein
MNSLTKKRPRAVPHGDKKSIDMIVTLNIPEDLYRQAKEIADVERRSVDEVITSAFADQMYARERLKQKAAKGSREGFLAVLAKVPDVEPEGFDRL